MYANNCNIQMQNIEIKNVNLTTSGIINILNNSNLTAF